MRLSFRSLWQPRAHRCEGALCVVVGILHVAFGFRHRPALPKLGRLGHLRGRARGLPSAPAGFGGVQEWGLAVSWLRVWWPREPSWSDPSRSSPSPGDGWRGAHGRSGHPCGRLALASIFSVGGENAQRSGHVGRPAPSACQVARDTPPRPRALLQVTLAGPSPRAEPCGSSWEEDVRCPVCGPSSPRWRG